MKIKKKISKMWFRVISHFIRPKIVVTQASLSGDGIFIDIRYWLSRPDKMNPKMAPYLITQQNEKLQLMHFFKFGVVQSKLRKHSNVGILLFYNKNKVVGKGEIVRLSWDGLYSEDIVLK